MLNFDNSVSVDVSGSSNAVNYRLASKLSV